MATHKSAIKRNRQNQQRRLRNKTIRSKMKTSIKSLLSAVEKRDKSEAEEKLKLATSIISKTASKGVIHKNAAARKIARLTKKVNVLQAIS